MTEWFMKMSEGKCKNLFILGIKEQNVQMGRHLTRKLAGKTEGWVLNTMCVRPHV